MAIPLWQSVNSADENEVLSRSPRRRYIDILDASAWPHRRNVMWIEHWVACGFSVFMLKAVFSGRGDEIVELAKVNLFVRSG
jgi:hypothetical protein